MKSTPTRNFIHILPTRRIAQLVVGPTAGPCFIDRLPIEILREVFLFHYYTGEERPAKLLYVSRRWQTIARETQTLWSTVHLHLCLHGKGCKSKPFSRDTDFKRYTSVAVQTFSLSELLKAIERLGLAKFTLLADTCYGNDVNFDGNDLFPAVEHLISCRCTTLAITAPFIAHDSLGLCWGPSALSRLLVKGSSGDWWRTLQSNFFTTLIENSHLRRVTLGDTLPPQLIRYPILLAVEHLSLDISRSWKSEDFERLFPLLRNIQTLSLRCRGGSFPIDSTSCTSNPLIHLELSLISLSIFAPSAFQSLVVLFLDEWDPSRHELAYPVSDTNLGLPFPSLRCLFFRGSHELLESILAPNLYILVVRPPVRDPSRLIFPPVAERSKLKMLMQPKYVSLELTHTTSSFVNAFLTASRDIVDLELVLNRWSLFSPVITNQLSENPGSGRTCPKLRNLMFTIKVTRLNLDFNAASQAHIVDKILHKRMNSPDVVALETLRYRFTEEGPTFDQHHGLGAFEDLWERGLSDGSEDTWENERKRLLNRQNWTDIVSQKPDEEITERL
ncbi:hypothetical protein CPB86DRAFT_280126 [Serendipita vermifera]|nr:hypothetical protein CPB86DRAFT_280126 [Serendipita vermifera]